MGMTRNNVLGALLLGGTLGLGFMSFAAIAGSATGTAAAAQPAPTVPQDPLGRTTPYGTVKGFLAVMAAGDTRRAASYLENPQSDDDKADLARQLKEVLDLSLIHI